MAFWKTVATPRKTNALIWEEVEEFWAGKLESAVTLKSICWVHKSVDRSVLLGGSDTRVNITSILSVLATIT